MGITDYGISYRRQGICSPTPIPILVAFWRGFKDKPYCASLVIDEYKNAKITAAYDFKVVCGRVSNISLTFGDASQTWDCLVNSFVGKSLEDFVCEA